MLSTYVDAGVEELEMLAPLPGGEVLVQTHALLDKKGLTTGSFELVGILSNPVNMPTQTALKESSMHRDQLFGPCPTAPAILRPVEREGVIKEPMAEAVKAYQTPLECKDQGSLEPVVEMAMKPHWNATQHYPRDVLSFEEAIVPPEGWKLKPINRKTSAGYKYTPFVSPKFPGKTAFLGFEGDVDFVKPTKALQTLRTDVDTIVERARQGIRSLHLCTDFLKDELRPLHKVENVATRMISATPLDYTVAVRMYFGAFLAAMFSTHVVNGMSPGLNHYKEWFMLAERLLERSDKVFDGDFSRFDASEQPWIHMAILRYVNRWYKFNNLNHRQEDDMVRLVLWMDLVHSRHITGFGSQLRYVVQWNKSLPSGHPLTTMVNSMYSLITLTGCYVALTGDNSAMWDHVFLQTFGDDNVNSVDDETCELFNQVTVSDKMKELFSLTYTPGDKQGVLVPYTNIGEVTFLKRSFVRDDDSEGGLIARCPNLGWVAPIDYASFLYEPYYYKSARNQLGDMETRIEHLITELALHSSTDWDLYFPKLQQWAVENGVKLPFNSRIAARLHVKTRLDVWY
jgi:hypothetical protein